MTLQHIHEMRADELILGGTILLALILAVLNKPLFS